VAKLKAPLMSLGASGAIGKALVYFGWKGIDAVREYVVPSNPKTTAQTTQRGYLSDAVDAIHAAQIKPVLPFVEADKSAYALLGSLQPTPRTWFNTIVKQWLDQLRASKDMAVSSGGVLTPGDTTLTLQMAQHEQTGDAMTNGKLHYGTSKTSLLNSIACTPAELAVGKEIPGLVNGVKYFVQYRPDTPVDYVGANSGIYYGVPAA